MEIKQLEYFIQICDDKTISKAAEHLYLTHQGLSKSVRSLEEELGASLYYKNKQKIVLTPAGEELYRQSKVLLKDMNALRQKMEGYAEKGQRKTLRIVCAYAVYGELYPLFFSGLQEAFPQILFEFSESPDIICEKAIMNEEADLGFTIGPFQAKSLIVEPLFKHGLCALVNKQHPLANRKQLFCSDLQNEKILIANRNFKIYHIFQEQCQKFDLNPDIAFLGSEISSIHSLSRANKGIAITVDFVGQYPGCNTIPFEAGTLDWTICMIRLKRCNNIKPVHDAANYIRKIYMEKQKVL